MNAFKIGDAIEHRYFGKGKIVEIYNNVPVKFKNSRAIERETYYGIAFESRPKKIYSMPARNFQAA